MLEKIEQIREEAQESLTALSTMDELEAWRLRYLGKKGVVTLALRSIGDLPREERPAAGRLANQVQRELAEAFEERREEIRVDMLRYCKHDTAAMLKLVQFFAT